jgi:hypothetical protein
VSILSLLSFVYKETAKMSKKVRYWENNKSKKLTDFPEIRQLIILNHVKSIKIKKNYDQIENRKLYEFL